MEGGSEEKEKVRGERAEGSEGRQRSFMGPVRASGAFQGRGGGSLPGRVGENLQNRGSGSLQAGRPNRKDLRYWGAEVPGATVGEASLKVRGGSTGWGEVDDPFKGF